MDKRRRTSSLNRLDEDMDDNSSEQSTSITTRKRKRLDPTEMCQQLYDSIRNYKKDDGTMLCDTFVRAPKRRQEPSYYDVVDNPIDLLRVQQKLKTDSYEDVEELTSDLDLLVKNSKAFYKADSTEYQDACLLWDIYNTNKQKLIESNVGEDEPNSKVKKIGRPRKSANYMDTDDASETSSRAADDEIEYYEELFAAVVRATDDTSRRLSTMFQFLPSKKLYPDYYDIIEHPIDLKFIATKIQTNAYISLSEMEKDFLQMAKNACTFNEPGSQIYKDAKTLKKIFIAKKQEIESGKFKPKEKPKTRGASLSATMAAMTEPVEESDDENDVNGDFEGDGPFWQLFDYLYNFASASENPNAPGVPLGESLWKLPNRRFHPEYYTTITKPISMAQIRNKLKKNEYSNITDLTADLYLMIDNAKKAYPPTHKSHKDAVKMLKIMNQRLVDVKLEEESDGDDEATSSSTGTIGKKKGRPKLTSTSPIASTPTPTLTTVSPVISSQGNSPKTTKFPNNPLLKKKLLGLQKFLSEYTLNGRRPMALFMEKPSKKLYPDYYDIIQHPIDMNTIEHNVKADKYGTLDDVVGDFRLMFANCRKYNEENSMIYEDANILERALNEKLKEFSGINDRRLTPKVIKGGRKQPSPMDAKLRQLYDAIRDYRDPKTNRQLALIFMKLPSKSDYPDYYDIIKNPMDMEKIAHRLRQQYYDSVEEIAADFMLMFENACKYNEPDSQIYKDALVLQQLCIKTKQSLRDDDTVPDVPQAVQELLLSLFTTFYNHQDEEGRCFSDSLAELDEYDTIDGNKVRAISLDLIKRRLDKGLYKRLDTFQEDVFQCLDRARRLSRTDSQIFEDSIELQSFFIKKRDEICKDVLTSPALSYSAMHLSASVEAVRQTKLLQEEQEQEQDNDITSTQGGESMTIDQKVYSPGDFVYYEIPDHKLLRVIYIERLWSNDGLKMMYGTVFLRPFETFHVTSRKFLEQELFKSDQHEAIPLDQLGGKCCVMSIKDYFKYKPEGFADKDIYVCESRYSTKLRAFKKIKNWPFANKTQLKQREVLLEPKRVMSVFKERVEKHKGELAELQSQEAMLEKEKPNILALGVSNTDDGNNYYEQYNTVGSGVVRTGDFVYVATETGKQSIAQIHTIWDSKDGKSYFRGPWFLIPPEVPGMTNRFFYRQELMQSTAADSSPIIAIVGRCSVLDFRDYTSVRPTEIPESDVYVCESTYDELKKQIRKHVQGMGIRKFQHSQMVTPDEVYHFKSPVVPVRVSAVEIAALEHIKGTNISDPDLKTESTEIYGMMEDSLDGGPPSVESDVVTASPAPSAQVATPVTTKRGKGKGKLVTGYILYSSEVRKDRAQNNPDCTFGDISRMVGNEWRNMTAQEKHYWEEKASRSNEESAIKYAEEHGCPSPVPVQSIFTAEPIINQIFECAWDKCDWQFEDPFDCLDHCLADGTGHVQSFYNNLQGQGNEIEYNCIWRGCIRMKKTAPSFPHMQRLIKHVREVHINKGGKIVSPNDRSKNFMPSKKVQQQHQQQLQAQQQQSLNQSAGQSMINNTIGPNQAANQSAQQQSQVVQIMTAPPTEPLFVTVPPRPQRVLHSEAYIKYIEGLQNESRFITPWEKTLRTTRETAPNSDASKLPMHWLGPASKEKSEDSVNMLWRLRNYMMKDVLQIPRSGYY